MKKIPLGFILASATILAADVGDWELAYHPADTQYAIYGGGLGDPIAPSDNDKKISFAIEGEAAREIFEAIGPDILGTCPSGPGIRVRFKDGGRFSCISDADGYVCHFGFNLNTGRSIGGSVC
jgi:hypothetical protein